MRRVTSGLCIAFLLAGMQAARSDEDYRRTAVRYHCGAYRCAPSAVFAPIMFRVLVGQLARRIH